jgi:hypothetical protein
LSFIGKNRYPCKPGLTKEMTKEIIIAEKTRKTRKAEKRAGKMEVTDAAVAKPKVDKAKKEKGVPKKDADKEKEKDKEGKKSKKDKKASKEEVVDLEALFANKEKPSAQKASDEIDELFASSKKPSTAKPTPSGPAKRPLTDAEDEDFTDSRGLKKKRRPTTAEGFPIYTAAEMRVGQGGDTPDCPFDCQCCF